MNTKLYPRLKLNEIRWVASVRFCGDKKATKIGIIHLRDRGRSYYDLVADTKRDVSCKCESFNQAGHAVWALWGRMTSFKEI